MQPVAFGKYLTAPGGSYVKDWTIFLGDHHIDGGRIGPGLFADEHSDYLRT